MVMVKFSDRPAAPAPGSVNATKLKQIVAYFRANKRATLSELSRKFDCNAGVYVDLLLRSQNRKVSIVRVSRAPAVYEWQGEV